MKPKATRSPKQSPVDLLILGLLLDRPRNAYELALFVQNTHLDKLLKISQPAVYKNCKRLCRSELLKGKTVRSGESPEKVAYTVNGDGKKRFHELMAHYSNEIKPFYFDHNSFLWNIEKLDRREGKAMLQSLQASFIVLFDWLASHEKEVAKIGTFGARALVNQYRMIMETLVRWIAETIKKYSLLEKKEARS